MRPYTLVKQVPCGDCLECREKRANSIYLRARLEYDRCLRKGGIGFMCCLTYSDDLLPTINMNGRKVSVFNKLHVIKFIKRLRTNLDRRYKRYYVTPNTDGVLQSSAPDFKYLVTSEYGTDPTKTHRPHYHMLVFFDQPISPNLFAQAFKESLYNRRSTTSLPEYYFGYIFQCDVIDPKKGGIHYSSKYVCKDVMYEPQRKFILDTIGRLNTEINQEFGILPEDSEANIFFNQCVRSTKAYKKAIETRVRPYRHMLQFYMCSNDFGISATIEKYGTSLETMPSINLDGFPYSLPAVVKTRYEMEYGKAALLKLQHVIFCKYFRAATLELIRDGFVTNEWAFGLNKFVETCCINLYGTLRLYDHSQGLDNLLKDLRSFDANGRNMQSYYRLCNEFSIYGDNDLFTLFDKVKKVLHLHSKPFYMYFRQKRANEKLIASEAEREKKKRNKGLIV